MDTKTIAVFLALTVSLSLLYLGFENKKEISEFENWKMQHSIKYNSNYEEIYRERVFKENIAKINEHNSKSDRTYDMGINQFTSFTIQEFRELYLINTIQTNSNHIEQAQDQTVGADVDWTTKGAVTPVKNQGTCPSPWAFAATGALEGLSKISYGKLQSFSEQQLVDCSVAYGNLGCNGGMVDYSFKYVKQKGIVTQQQYPYVSAKQNCTKTGGNFKISGFSALSTCATLESALASRPIAVAVDADKWLSYKSGVLNDCGTRLNHFSLLVGSNAESWKIKNSWGATWGEQGYIRIKKGNTCGVCNVASYPLK